MKRRAAAAFIVLVSLVALSAVYAANSGSLALPGVPGQVAPSVSPISPTTGISVSLWLEDPKGEIFIKRQEGVDFERVEKRLELRRGDEVKVEKGACRLVLADRSEITLGPHSHLSIDQLLADRRGKAQNTSLRLNEGRIKAKVTKLSAGSQFEVVTPTAVASVRGTVFYLGAGFAENQKFSELYVDEGAVNFGNLKSQIAFLIKQFASSNAFGDGSILSPHELDPAEREAFIRAWNDQVSQYLQQGGIEEEAASALVSANFLNKLFQLLGTDDAKQDKKSEQDTKSQFAQDAAQLASSNSPQVFSDKHDENVDAIRSLIQETKSETPSFIGLRAPELAQKADGVLDAGSGQWDYLTSYAYRDLGIVSDARRNFIADADPGVGPLGAESLSDPKLIRLLSQDGQLHENLLGLREQLQQIASLMALAWQNALVNEDNQAQFDQAQSLAQAYRLTSQEVSALLQQAALDYGSSNNNIEGLLKNTARGLEALREAERSLMRHEIARLREDLDFEHADANLERIADAQTGKVFNDVHGRVRVDQYIFQPDPSQVELISLSLRTGDYQPGISSVVMNIQFNQSITGSLRDLPWNDYLNVVTQDEMTSHFADFGNRENPLENAGQFVVHEGAENAPALFPTRFEASFSNPTHDTVRFNETYSDPFGFEGEGGTLWIQAQTAFTADVLPFEGQAIHVDFLSRPPQNNQWGEQTFFFTERFDPTDLGNINNFIGENHPAYFLETGLGPSRREFLAGLFLPIDNEGRLITGSEGFSVQGLRDILSPNPLVNGGNYNLEIILYQGSAGTNPETGQKEFQEAFRIDTVITPEIFQPYGTTNVSSLFPATLGSSQAEDGGAELDD